VKPGNISLGLLSRAKTQADCREFSKLDHYPTLDRPDRKLTVLIWMVGTLIPLKIALTAGTLWVVLGLRAGGQ
jgi:hypothetical protein